MHNRWRQSGGDHGLRHPRHVDAGARHHHRQCRVAVYAGQRFGDPGPDCLGVDLLHRRCRDHDPADGPSRQPVRPQAPFPGLGRRVHRRLSAVWHVAVTDADRAVPHPARRLRRGARAAIAIRAAQHQPAGTAGIGDGDMGGRGDGRSCPRSGSRRLADRELHVALCLLHQCADRHHLLPRHESFSDRHPEQRWREAGLVRLRHAEPGDRRGAAYA